jgi:hypothetical protein
VWRMAPLTRHPPLVRRRFAMSTVRSFTYRASDAELDDLRRRVLATRLPEKETTNAHGANFRW